VIAELKTSALDLSKELNIDELSALRIVVLEHQARAAKSLMVAEAGAAGDADMGASTYGVSFLESVLNANKPDDAKQKENKILYDRVEVYLSERRYVIKVATALLRASLSGASKTNPWSEVAQKFREHLKQKKGWSNVGVSTVEGISARWFEVGEKRDGLPAWVKKGMEDYELREQVEYVWEKQVIDPP
jgi:nuclear pore complex protein Nup188